MKKILVLFIAVIMLLTAAAFAEEESSAPAGGWIPRELHADIPEEALTAFGIAMKQYESDWNEAPAYAPVALLSTQVVNGVNYLFLCTEAPVDEGSVDWVFVTVYADLSGGAVISQTSSAGLNMDESDFEMDTGYETESNDDGTIFTVRIDCDEVTGTDWNITLDEETLELISGAYIPFGQTDENGVTGQFTASFRAKDGIAFRFDSVLTRVQIVSAALIDSEPAAAIDMQGEIQKDGTLDFYGISCMRYAGD